MAEQTHTLAVDYSWVLKQLAEDDRAHYGPGVRFTINISFDVLRRIPEESRTFFFGPVIPAAQVDVAREAAEATAISIPFATLPVNQYIRGPRYRVMFDRTATLDPEPSDDTLETELCDAALGVPHDTQG